VKSKVALPRAGLRGRGLTGRPVVRSGAGLEKRSHQSDGCRRCHWRLLDLRREFGVVVTYPLPNPLPYQLRKLSHLERFFLGDHAGPFIIADVPFAAEFLELANRAFIQLESERQDWIK